MNIEFSINRKKYLLDCEKVSIETSLNTYLREYVGLTGTKFMCLEGGCGVCVVMVQSIHPVTNEKFIGAVNSCLMPIYSCHNFEITTIEDVGNRKDGYDPIQERLVQFNGSQCGYCSPGIIMNMMSLYKSKPNELTTKEVENSFGGNICRCTGYRSILDSMKSFAMDAPDELMHHCRDIEDLKLCSKKEFECLNLCTKWSLHFFENKKEWHKVYEIKEIVAIFKKIRQQKYMLVAGNTAHGVYRRDRNIEVFIDVSSVKELRVIWTDNKSLHLGGNVTLSEVLRIFKDISRTDDKNFRYLSALHDHIDLVANIPVRNFGTIAGNLSIKHQHNEFPSDIFLILEGIGAIITIVDQDLNAHDMSLLEYLQTDMNKKIISQITLPKLQDKTYEFRSYKIMPRAQNAHAYVNAVFLVKFTNESDIINSIRLCFGGINESFVHAKNTEQLIMAKYSKRSDFYNASSLQEIFNTLSDEIIPDSNPVEASPEYRKNLTISLFYKFILEIIPKDKITEFYRSGGEILQRPISSGRQSYDTKKNKYPLTQPIIKREGIYQASGEAKYVNDIPYQLNQLWAAFVEGTKCGKTIGKIDASKALSHPGVVAFYSAKDIPGINDFTPPFLVFNSEEEEIFCSSKIRFNGQPIGIIVAETFELANYAVDLVEVEYISNSDDVAICPTLKSALSSKNVVNRMFDKSLNQVEENSEYEIISQQYLKGHLEFRNQYHYHMETQTCICYPNEENLHVYSSTQWMDGVQVAISRCLKIPQSRINIEVLRLGGSFGSKITRSCQIACACALASHLLNRPVRFVMKLESNMTVIGKRYGCLCNYEVGFNLKGKIESLTNTYYQDYGIGLNQYVQHYTNIFFPNCYSSDNWKVKGISVLTDVAKNTWMRSPGATEGIAMIENIIEHIAFELELEPADVRMLNMKSDYAITTIFPNFLKSVKYRSRKQEINDFNKQNRWRKRGIAAMPMRYHIEYFGPFSAFVAIYHADGTVVIQHGGIEMGQGLNTKAIQVAAYILGISHELIAIKASNTVTGANSVLSGSSITSETICYAVKKSCEILNERLKPIKLANPGKQWYEITREAHNKNIDLRATYNFIQPDAKNYDTWGSSCAEVEIDILTGNYIINRVDILEDVGESMNPLIDVGQLEGAFVQGLGYWLTEKLIYDRINGALLTNRTWNYKVPGAKDIPVDFRIEFLRNSGNNEGILRSKTVGEVAMSLSVVVVFALRHAINSARKNVGINEYYDIDFPLSPESVAACCGTKISELKIN